MRDQNAHLSEHVQNHASNNFYRLTRRSFLALLRSLSIGAAMFATIHRESRVMAEQLAHGQIDNANQLHLIDFYPAKATFCPDDAAQATFWIEIHNPAAQAQEGTVQLHLSHLASDLATTRYSFHAAPGTFALEIPLALPVTPFQGYGVHADLLNQHGHTIDSASTACDVLTSWTMAPRYGFFSDFGPHEQDTEARVTELQKFHINVVQYYDWMWRHYQLLPPHQAAEFSDALGRVLSLETVRHKIAMGRARNMAALGYAAVYGAEPDYALAHPADMLYDAQGQPYSLEKLFYIMNIHRGTAWRAHILHEMAAAVRAMDFDGLHLDQYGFPHTAFGPGTPEPGKSDHRATYDLSQDFPPFIDDARAMIRQARPGTRVIFNAVGNWPIENVAPTTQDATYIEVWPPYTGYDDLQALIQNARHLAPQKQVILAAYIKPFSGAVGDALLPAQAATRLANAAIVANGGFHLLFGERDAVLDDPYYPAYGTMMPQFARVMRCYADMAVRYENVLSDLRSTHPGGDDRFTAVRVHSHPAAPIVEPGMIWTIARQQPGYTTVSLINLTAAQENAWNSPQPVPPQLRHIVLDIAITQPVARAWVATPDHGDLSPQPLSISHEADNGRSYVRLTIPTLDYWSLIVLTHSQD